MQSAPQKIHFVGIGGTAMTGGALLAQELGFSVQGSDQKLFPPTSDALKAAGITYNEAYSAANIAYRPDRIVLGNAISRGNAELEAALDARVPIVSLPEFIAEYVIGYARSFVVAGTHGKTTTTALAAHILRANGINAGYLIGGIANNFERSAEVGDGSAFVIEGDEYDTSIFDHRSKFLSYRPTHVIINNIEFDHADIFTDLDAVEKAFSRLIKIIPQNGLLVINADNESCVRLRKEARSRVITFGESAEADYRLDSTAVFPALIRRGKTLDIKSPLSGRHNALNVLAALAMLEDFKIPDVGLAQALASFTGVKRRLEKRLENKDFIIIEDFAHHPTAIAANLETLKTIYPVKRLVVLIEPRSNTMVRNFFQDALARALGHAEVVFIDAIYRAEKYADNERLDLKRLANDLEAQGKKVFLLPAENKSVYVREKLLPQDLICFMTNGSFGGLIGQLVTELDIPDENPVTDGTGELA